ncbi:hypothetical protein J5288_08455 [Agrobacterium sp. S2/73]|uniref:hypothetical protein n=1 Tax=unclassified Agrobacterium TaxID=2632611 RepID=UPI001AD9B1F9|nr:MULTISPECIES: hypothetical protein [unclassified Agrobacterium]MBO9108732.1 hypothetical protein [Agrobacterium sp. S2/73]QXZ73510.1 hypothetical protein J5276_06055 [Agrobacterium sp. S7/73]
MFRTLVLSALLFVFPATASSAEIAGRASVIDGLGLVIDHGSALEFAIAIDPTHALQLSDQLREQALQLLSSTSPRKN